MLQWYVSQIVLSIYTATELNHYRATSYHLDVGLFTFSSNSNDHVTRVSFQFPDFLKWVWEQDSGEPRAEPSAGLPAGLLLGCGACWSYKLGKRSLKPVVDYSYVIPISSHMCPTLAPIPYPCFWKWNTLPVGRTRVYTFPALSTVCSFWSLAYCKNGRVGRPGNEAREIYCKPSWPCLLPMSDDIWHGGFATLFFGTVWRLNVCRPRPCWKRYVTFNLPPLPPPTKIGSPRNAFFWNIWIQICSYVNQPQEGKSMHINGHEVTNKDISGVHSSISRKLSDWFLSVCLGWPTVGLLSMVLWIKCSVWFCREMRLVHCILLNFNICAWIVFRNLNNLLDKPLVQIL